MGQALQLYQLQSIDSEIDKANDQLAEISRKLQEDEAVKRARDAVESAETNLRKAQAAMQDLDLEVKGLTTKIDTEERLLYSGKVLNAKEAANLQEEVASLKRRQSEREERLLEAMFDVEATEEVYNRTRAQLASTEAAWDSSQEQLKQTESALRSRLSELTERRPTLAKALKPADLNIYEKLRSKKAGRAVVSVKNNVCQGCGITVSNNLMQRARTGLDLTYCTTCGRILYVT